MKNSNITKNRMRVALPLVLAASITGLAPAFSTSARAGSGSFSINDVSGIYVDLGGGYTYGAGNAKQSVPDSFVGLVTFTAATGTFHADWIAREYGENGEAIHDGTYTMDANGHGTMTWLSDSGLTKHRDFYIVSGGAELKYINTDPPGTVIISNSGTMTKQ